MAIDVLKLPLASPQDVSGLAEAFGAGRLVADQVAALIGKTEGNGGVNDFSRILADLSFRAAIAAAGSRSRAEVDAIPMVWSGGCDGVISPHAVLFARTDEGGPVDQSRMTLGVAISEEILPEDIGRLAMVEKIAAGVRAAMRSAGIVDPNDVHFVQTKTPLLTIASAAEAARRGQTVAGAVQGSSGLSNGTSALGVAVGLGEIEMPAAEQICRDLDLYSSVASCSSGVEFNRAQIVLMGNRPGAGGRLRVGHALMRDMLDMDGVYAGDPQRRSRPAGASASRGHRRPAGRPVHQVRAQSQRPPDGAAAGDVQRFRHPLSPPRQGGGRRRGDRGDRRSLRLHLGRRHAFGPHGSGPVAAIVDVGP